jgi:ectoine hydroxylase
MKLLSKRQTEQFKVEGFLQTKALFDAEEIELLRSTAHADRELDKHSFSRADGEGGKVRLSLWNHPGDNIYGMFARCNKMVDRAEELLGDEVYHYHSKMILKDPRIGGAWTWHQDYGYWYQNGLILPDLVSVFIAVDKATRENGCLQVIKGSHHMGRIDHILTGDQAGGQEELRRRKSGLA